MIIKGVSIFIVEIPRIEDTLRRFDKRFIEKIFWPEELNSSGSKHLAGRFAGKAAVKKLIGNANWRDIEIISFRDKPRVKLWGKARVIASKKEINSIKLSISHERKQALAVAVGVGK